MGNLLEVPWLRRTPERTQDENLTRFLDKINRQDQNVLKLLLLGAGDSGKTTILKQMHILYGNGISENILIAAKKPLFRELVLGAKETVKATGVVPNSRPLSRKNSIIAAKRIEEYDVETQEDFLPEAIATAIAVLWEDPDIQDTWYERSNYQILDSWGDFASQCKNYPAWGGPRWVPSIKEFLYTRIKTSGVIQETFRVDGTTFQIVDVGGQRSERRKWIHCFDGVTAVLFVAAISEYDQFLYEERKKNRLEEALDLFDTMANTHWFQKTTMLLFLNKADIFREKLCVRHIKLNTSGLFPDAPNTFDFYAGVDWIRQEFLKRNEFDERPILSHITTATDTNTVQAVLDACKQTILMQALQKMNFYP